MLIYDEWVVPGEVEYAEKKAVEIEGYIRKYHKDIKTFEYWSPKIYFPITEHVVAEFEVIIPYSDWNPLDYHIRNKCLLNWYRGTIAPIDSPKMFNLPPDDIRSSLPEWDESLLPEDPREDIMNEHSIRRNVTRELEKVIEYGINRYMLDELNLSEVKLNRIAESFIKKLETNNIEFTETEKRITEYYRREGYFHDSDFYIRFYNLEPWYFPLDMTDDSIVEVIREAYVNASKRSKRMTPAEVDAVNMLYSLTIRFSFPHGTCCPIMRHVPCGNWKILTLVSINVWPRYECQFIENYQCLYQGRAGDLVIRFLFDFKNMKIVNAYPVMNKNRRVMIKSR